MFWSPRIIPRGKKKGKPVYGKYLSSDVINFQPTPRYSRVIRHFDTAISTRIVEEIAGWANRQTALRNIAIEDRKLFFAFLLFTAIFTDSSMKSCSRDRKKRNVFDVKWTLNTRNFRDRIDEKWKQIYGTGWILFSIFLPFLFSFPFLLNSDVLTNERHLGIDKKRKNQRAKGGSDFFCQDEEGEREWIVRMHQVEHACTFISVWRRGETSFRIVHWKFKRGRAAVLRRRRFRYVSM